MNRRVHKVSYPAPFCWYSEPLALWCDVPGSASGLSWGLNPLSCRNSHSPAGYTGPQTGREEGQGRNSCTITKEIISNRCCHNTYITHVSGGSDVWINVIKSDLTSSWLNFSFSRILGKEYSITSLEKSRFSNFIDHLLAIFDQI
jgi:hypothetical protein